MRPVSVWDGNILTVQRMENREERKDIIAVVGAGGKTSLIMLLARWFLKEGRRVIITTTTHMYEPPEGYYREGQLEDIIRELEKSNKVWVGEPAKENKITGVSEEFLEKLFALDAVVLIEADGARHLPCKVPAEHEPVIPKEVKKVIGVAGLDCLGKPLEEVCFRWELAAGLLKTDRGHRMTEKDLIRLLLDSQGMKKGIPAGADYMVVLNKADLPGVRDAGERIKKALLQKGCECMVLSCREVRNESIN